MRALSFPRLLLFFTLMIFFGVFLSGCSIPFRSKPVAGLQVSTAGGSALVILNGEEKGITPFTDQQLRAGEYSLKLVPVDSELSPYETTIELFQGTLSVVDWTWGTTTQESGGVIIEVEPMTSNSESELSISSNPDGAIVKVDDTSQGFTPVLMKSVTAGAHRYSVNLPGYQEQSHTVTAIEGFRMNISIMLAKEPQAEMEDVEAEVASDSSDVATVSAKSKATPTPTPKKSASRLSTETSTASATASGEGTVTIIETGTGWLRVRETPSTSGKEVAKVDVGETFPFTDSENGWYEIQYEKDKTGWVIGTFVKKN